MTYLPDSPPAFPDVPPAIRLGRQHERRLLAAFEAIETFPCLDTSRQRVLDALARSWADLDPVIAVIESDLALTTRLLRDARQVGAPVGNVRDAVDVLGPMAVRGLVATTPTVDFFSKAGGWGTEAIGYRRHVTAVQTAVHRIATRTRIGAVELDQLMAAAALHDIGKLVLNRAYAGVVEHPVPDTGTPEERLAGERQVTGVDHAVVGGVLVRRWGLPAQLARLVECHHVDDPANDRRLLVILRLADALANFGRGGAVSPARMTTLARRAGLDRAELRELLFDQDAVPTTRPRHEQPNPLSERETEVLRHLSEGLVYKQIATELELATSTIRTHLHNIYLKLGAVDRAQAVLIAVRSGWI